MNEDFKDAIEYFVAQVDDLSLDLPDDLPDSAEGQSLAYLRNTYELMLDALREVARLYNIILPWE